MITWLSSYPRSGNTFLRIILKKKFGIRSYSIYDDEADIGADDKTSDIVGHSFLPDGFELTAARAESQQYFIKTHELPDERISDKDRVIYLMRDGRESAYSLVKHQRKFGARYTILADVINGNVFGGLWGKHVSAWSPGTRSNCLLIKYEDLVSSTDEQVNRLSGFIDMVAKKTRIPAFKSLQKINPDFFNSGKTDTWRQVYTEEDNFLFWLKNYRVMKEYGYLDSMPDYFKSGRNLGLFRAISDENAYFLNTFIKHSGILNSRISELAHAKDREEQSSLQLLNSELLKNNALQDDVRCIRGEISDTAEACTKQADLLGRIVNEQKKQNNRLLDAATEKVSLAEKQNLHAIIERKTAEADSLNNRVKTLLAESSARATEIETLKKENNRLLNAVNEKESLLVRKDDERKEASCKTEEQLQRLRAERNSIARESLAEIENLHSIIARKTAEADSLNDRVEALVAESSARATEIETLKKEAISNNDNYRENTQRAEKELETTRKRHEADLKALNEVLSGQKLEKARLNQDLSDQKLENARLNQDLSDQKLENARLAQNLSDLTNRDERISKELADRIAEYGELLKCNAKLEGQLDRWRENSRITLEKCTSLQAELDKSRALINEIFGTKRWRYTSKLIEFMKK